MDGNALLSELVALYHKHIYFSDDYALTCSLWVIWTYLVHEPYIEVSPYLGFTAPDKRCAKTRCLDLTERLVLRGYCVSDLSQAAFFRLSEKYHPTLLIDEVHHLLARPSGLLGMLLNAYDRHKPVTRVNPENNNEVEEFDIWSGKALAYLGILDPQLRDRVIEIRLERKPSTVKKPNCERPPVNIRTNCNANASVGLATTQRPLARSGRLISISQNDRAGNNWEFFLAIAGVIDPDNVDLSGRYRAQNRRRNQLCRSRIGRGCRS